MLRRSGSISLSAPRSCAFNHQSVSRVPRLAFVSDARVRVLYRERNRVYLTMHPYILLLMVSSSLTEASWVKLPGYRDLVGRGSFPPPRETGQLTQDDTKGWTPKPTPAPGSLSESNAVLELLREKRAATSYSWEDDTTCGWTAGVACMCRLPFDATIGLRSGDIPGLVF